MKQEKENSLTKLLRALFYEAQFRNALVSDAITYFDANLSKNLIESDFFFKDKDGNLRSVLDFTGLSAPCSFSDFVDRWVERLVPDISKKNFPYIGKLREHLLEEYKEGNREFTVNYWVESPFGERVYFNHLFLLLKNDEDDICAFSVIKDYTQIVAIDEKARFSQIEEYAYIDPVTKGYNYVKFKEQLHKYALPGVIISVDIHSFKIINSISGISKGDAVLKKIWNSILELTEIDKMELAAHINADHFIIFMPTFDKEKIIQRIKNITYVLNIISTELDVPVLRPYFGVSFWNSNKKIELSYSESVVAKKKARENTETNFSFFEENDTKRIFEEKSIIDNFETALAKKDFIIYYQPKYAPNTKRLVGAEALIRWQKNDGTIMNPGSFIPIFEQNGMIRILDEYVFRNVCKQQKKWLSEGKNIVPVSVNLSRASLYYKNVVQQYTYITQEIDLDRQYVPIEITETAAITNNEIKQIADEFFKEGFSIHMDDFGSGYSSLASLNIMHIETLKLDKSLIDYIGNFGGNRLIEHTISLAKELGIHVTAEGVENEDQVDFLNDVGCDSIQGFYFSKPVPTLEFEKLLSKHSNNEKLPSEETILNHISDFKLSWMKRPLYTFVANLTKDFFTEGIGKSNWHNEMDFSGNSYQTATEILTNDYVLPEYKEAYKSIMYRDKLIDSYKGISETRLFEYKRKHFDKVAHFRLTIHLFMVSDSPDLWMYFTVTDLS